MSAISGASSACVFDLCVTIVFKSASRKERGQVKRHEQEFERGCIMLDRLLILAQRECPFRMIERVADGCGRIGG